VLPTFLILNPRSGNGKNEKHIPSIISHFKTKNIPFGYHVTTHSDDARKVASEVKEKFQIVVAAGGDGTINEVVNGIAGSNTILGILPLGSGNDFAKAMRYPKQFNQCLELLSNQGSRTIDLALIEALNSVSEKKSKYFINSVGIGLDAQVASEAGRINWVRGLPKYSVAALNVVFGYKAESSWVSSAEFESVGKHLLISIGNGKSSGGGFYLTPEALLDDGMLDVCLAKNLSIFEILKIFPFVFLGKHARFQKIEMRRTTKLVVKTETDLPVHVDGEVLGLDIREVRIEAVPLAIRVLTA